MKLTRRTTLSLMMASAAAAILPLSGCGRANSVRHILPSATPGSFTISVSVQRAIEHLYLDVDGRSVPGQQRDSKGRFWSFHVDGLDPDTEYNLRLYDDDNLTEEIWPLRTFPDPASMPESFRLMAYTCAGGADGFGFGKRQFFKPHAFRQKLFDEGLAKSPHAVIALGDQIYWDLRGESQPQLRRPPWLIRNLAGWYLRFKYGAFDRSQALIGTKNEAVLTRIGDEQIADLYGTRFRSVPMFFVSDDHDYFENDDAEEALVTFPPDPFSKAAYKAIASLYYPPLPDGPVADANYAFGTLKYGQLFEAPLFDCAGHLSLDGEEAGLVPPAVEQWLVDRAANSPARHFAFVPSHPMGWTAGKWREWYPDVMAPEGFTGLVTNTLMSDVTGVMTAEAEKFLWPRGWWNQHQRLLQAIGARRTSRLMFSGDIHAQGAVQIEQSGSLGLEANPVTSVLVGPVGTSDATWPSAARGTVAAKPGWLETNEIAPIREINGFTLLEFDQAHARVSLYNCGGYDRSLNEDGRVQSTQEFEI